MHVCRYEHLSACLKKLLLERPKNAVDVFEDVSRRLKKEKLSSKTDTLVVSSLAHMLVYLYTNSASLFIQ